MDKDIIKQYPLQFSGGLYWLGISIGAGWMPIVAQVCQEIQEALSAEDLRKFHWIQIKQKPSGLKMYWGPKPPFDSSAARASESVAPQSENNDENQGDITTDLTFAVRARITEIIERAQERASITCENCGAVVKQEHEPRIGILCDACKQLEQCLD